MKISQFFESCLERWTKILFNQQYISIGLLDIYDNEGLLSRGYNQNLYSRKRYPAPVEAKNFPKCAPAVGRGNLKPNLKLEEEKVTATGQKPETPDRL